MLLPNPKNSGFSLVELSIVLVILGLLTGGILAGQSLIRASELRAVSAETQRFSAAANTFRDKYFGWPGDITNATQFWGRLNSNTDCVTNSAAGVVSPGACDGNSDGFLGMGTTGAAKSMEIYQFWRQLALAGLIEGSYTGLSGSGTSAHVPSNNTIGSKLSDGAYAIWCCGGVTGDYAGDSVYFAGNYQHTFVLGAVLAANWPIGPLLKPEELWNIDTKADDGKPGTGKFLGMYWNNACAQGATTAADTSVATYKLSDNSRQCVALFTNAF